MACTPDGLDPQSRHFFGAVAQLWSGGSSAEGADEGDPFSSASRRRFTAAAPAEDGTVEGTPPNDTDSTFEDLWRSKRASLGKCSLNASG